MIDGWEPYYPIWPFGQIKLTDGSSGPRNEGLYMRRKDNGSWTYRRMTVEERGDYEAQSMDSVL